MTSHQTENNAPKNSAPAAGHRPHGPHGPHGASEDPQNIYLLKEAPILKALLSLGVPMALGLAITSIYNVVNSYFVGHYGGTEDLAATSYGVPVFGVINERPNGPCLDTFVSIRRLESAIRHFIGMK